MLSDLIGEVQEVQPVSNISTAADLLKQGAGKSLFLSSWNALCHVFMYEQLSAKEDSYSLNLIF